jgi:transposase
MNYCGIDLASKTSAVCVMDPTQTILRELILSTDAQGFSQGLRGLGRLRCVVEAAPLAEWVAQLLEGLGHEVVVIDPRRAKAVVHTKNKTDKLDARNLANLARTGWYTAVHRKSAAARLQRTQLQARQGLVETEKAQAARIRGLLRVHGLKLGHVSASQLGPRAHELAQQVPALPAILAPLIRLYEHAREAATALKKTVTRQAQQSVVCQRLMQVPGVGPLVVSTFVATIDDPTRFKNSAHVPAYLGLVPRVHQSGETHYHGRISKEGDKLLRWLLVEAAHVLLTRTRRSCALKRWGLKLAKKRGHGKAAVAVARKLAILLHRLWVTGKDFTPTPATT